MIQKINLPKIYDPRGNLTFIEGGMHIPFEISRVYWIYDVPGGESRGGHAFKKQQEFIVALSGSFDIVIHDGLKEERIHLNRSYNGLFVPNGVWRSMDNFSTNSVAMVLASTSYDEADYIRDFEIYKSTVSQSADEEKVVSGDAAEFSFDIGTTTVWDCKLVDVDINHRDKGNITVAEGFKNLPFNINRVYYLYDVPGGEERGGHAHKELQQWIVAASGSFDVVLDDGHEKRSVTLNRPYKAIQVVPGIWRELNNFSSGSICLVLASHHYEEHDYIRNYEDFIKLKSV